MARRKRYFRRTQPDRGWFVSSNDLTFTVGGSFSVVNVVNVFDFEDITADDLVTQDKSDWFIKRVIVDAYPVVGRQTATSAPARIWGLGLGTLQDDVALSWDLSVLTTDQIFSADSMDRWRRTFRLYNKPVYATWNPATVSGQLAVDEAAATNQLYTADSPWGDSAVHDDFEVSNAGLVPDSGMYAVIGTAPGPSNYDWASGDTLTVQCYTRTLLQKRRAN